MIQKLVLFKVEELYFMNAKRRLEEILFKMSLKQGHQDLFEWPNDIDEEPCPISLKTEKKGVKRSL